MEINKIFKKPKPEKIFKKEPDTIFIIPYRNRERHLEIFLNHMEKVLSDINYLLLIVHQNDNRHFNRGAIKNIGFKFVKKQFPLTYRNKNLIFHDVDVLVWKKNIFSFKTEKGIVKHHFGFPKNVIKSLGGIFTIKAGDFEKVNGFPNYWSWGYEDNCIFKRVDDAGFYIDYSNFRHIKHKDVIMFWHGEERLFNQNYIWKKYTKDNNFGIKQIYNLNYELKNYQKRENVYMMNVHNFSTPGEYPTLKRDKPPRTFETQNQLEHYKKLFNM